MSNILIRLYQFFTNRKGLLAVLPGSILIMSALVISRIEVKENIFAFLPRKTQFSNINSFLDKNPLLDQVIFVVSKDEKSPEINNTQLVAFSDKFVSGLRSGFAQNITSIRYTVPQDTIFTVYSLFYNNLPVFYSEDDYALLEEKIKPAAIDKAFKENYKLLTTPGSYIFKQFITGDPLGFTQTLLKKLQNINVEDNFHFYNNRIFTKDNQNLVFFIYPKHSANMTSDNARFFNKLDKYIDAMQSEHGNRIRVRYFGAPVVAADNAVQIKNDILLTVGIALLLIFSIIIFILRDKKIIFSLLVPLVLGGSIALALVVIIKGNLSLISLGIGSVLVGITVDYAIHIITHIKRTGNIIKSIRDVTLPVIMSSITTASAFFCLVMLKSDILEDLGLFASMSVIFAALTALIVLPHFYSKTTPPQKTKKIKWFKRLIHYRFEQNRMMIAVICIIMLVFVVTDPHITFEKDLNTLNYTSPQTAAIEKKLGTISSFSLKSLMLITKGKTLDEALAQNEQLYTQLQQLETEKMIGKTFSAAPLLMSSAKQHERISLWRSFWTAEKKDLLKKRIKKAAEKYNFRPDSFSKFFALLDRKATPLKTADLLTLKDIFYKDLVSVRDNSVSVTSFLKVKNSAKEHLYTIFEVQKNITIADRQYIITRFINYLEKEYMILVNISLLVVFIILLLFLGRLEFALMTMVPIVSSWILILGVMNLCNLSFNIFNIIIATFIFGLGIDYSIFIMRGLIQQYTSGKDLLASYKSSIFFSACTTIIGMGALLFAEHPALNSIAALSVLGILSVLFLSFTVLPFLFSFFIDRGAGRRPLTIVKITRAAIMFILFTIGCLVIFAIGIILFILPITSHAKKQGLSVIIMSACKLCIKTYTLISPVTCSFHNFNSDVCSRPSVIIANHQSMIDIILMLSLSSKLIIMTKKWVWHSPLFGHIARLAGFYPNDLGFEKYLHNIKKQVQHGYSLVIFPEGSRSPDTTLKRFHKGAFLIAEELGLEIRPLLIHGTGKTLPRDTFIFEPVSIHVTCLHKTAANDTSYGTSYKEKAVNIRKYMQKEYNDLYHMYYNNSFSRTVLFNNIMYRQPYMIFKTKIELLLNNSFKTTNTSIPRTGNITEIGFGPGILTYILATTSQQRKITAIETDRERYDMAVHNARKAPQHIVYVYSRNIFDELKESTAFIFNTIMKKISSSRLTELLDRCLHLLSAKGSIIIITGNKRQLRNCKTVLDKNFAIDTIRYKIIDKKNILIQTTKNRDKTFADQ